MFYQSIRKEVRINWEKTTSSLKGAGTTGQLHAKKMKLGCSLPPYIKINSKWIKYLNKRSDTIKNLMENIGRTPFDVNRSNIFMVPSPRVMELKTKINGTLLNSKAFAQQRKA